MDGAAGMNATLMLHVAAGCVNRVMGIAENGSGKGFFSRAFMGQSVRLPAYLR
jgi:Fe-S cluster assembly ATPase SufC